jgi:hypothetical protein
MPGPISESYDGPRDRRSRKSLDAQAAALFGEPEDDEPAWVCPACDLLIVGHLHCARCGARPPWGCDCDQYDPRYEPEPPNGD